MIVLYFLGYFYRNKQNSYAALTCLIVSNLPIDVSAVQLPKFIRFSQFVSPYSFLQINLNARCYHWYIHRIWFASYQSWQTWHYLYIPIVTALAINFELWKV